MWLLVALLCCPGWAQYFRSGAKERVGLTPVLVATCDLSGDGINDFAVTNFGDSSGAWERARFPFFPAFRRHSILPAVSVMVNQQVGGVFRPQFVTPSNGPFGIACIDIDRDGRYDLVWGNDGRQGAVDNTLSYVLNRGFDGSSVIFELPPVVLEIGFNPSDIAVADFDKNGADDLVITITDNNQVAILYNMHNGSASSPVRFEQVWWRRLFFLRPC